ncbi:MAG: restriction endonuclease subunit S [Rhodoferax sp.]|nr:restriction endonuclease subunit S [Rhodoferax sp.]
MPQNIGDNRISEDGIARITLADAKRLSRYLVRAGDIVYSRRGDVERRALIREREVGWLCGTGCLRVRFGEGTVYPPYAAYYLGHPIVREWIVRHAQGATMPNLNTTILSSLPFVLPPLEEQRAIAQILATLDDKIELNRRMNETLEAMARAIFQSWFVDFDPVRAKASGESVASICQRLGLTPELLALFPDSFEDSELGEIPKGWAVTTLQGMTSKIGSGATPRGGREVYLEEGTSLIRSQNVYDSNFVWDGLAHITDEAAKQLNGVEVKEGDVLINITGASILRTCVVDPHVLPARVNQHVAIIRAKAGFASRYIHLHLLGLDTKAYLMGLNAGASREAVTKGHLESVPIIDPGEKLLECFGKTVASLYAEVDQLTHQGRTLQSLRDTLLPKLLSGEMQVPPTEA